MDTYYFIVINVLHIIEAVEKVIFFSEINKIDQNIMKPMIAYCFNYN